MAKTNNVKSSDVNEGWTIEEIQDANSLSHFKKINTFIASSFVMVNFGIIICTFFYFLAREIHMELPDISNIAIKQTGGPICALNALLLVVLALGHDDYYKRTERMLILSDYMGLQWIDFIIKLSLLFVSILQCMHIDFFVGICCYGYILTFFRALYLKNKLDKEHPLWKEVQEKWYPNNIRHNLAMLCWTIFYYFLLDTNYIYIIICYLNKNCVDFRDPEVKKMLIVIKYCYILIFDIYWIYRVLDKKIIQKNKSFKSEYEKNLEKNVEKYYSRGVS